MTAEEFVRLARRRRMVRAYDPERPVPVRLTEQLVEVARQAPSAGFSQATSLLLLESATDRDRFWSASSPVPAGSDRSGAATRADPTPESRWVQGMRSAPLLIMVWTSRDAYLDRYAEADKGWADRDQDRWAAPYWFVDAGMAAMSMLHAVSAAGDGLGACFFGIPPQRLEAVRSAFGVPADQQFVGVVSVGYRSDDERPSGSPRRRGRRPATAQVHAGRWADSVTTVTQVS